jgi:predicted transcriptional regulator
MSNICTEIEEMYNDGHSVASIAMMLGIPTYMVVDYIETFMMEEIDA